MTTVSTPKQQQQQKRQFPTQAAIFCKTFFYNDFGEIWYLHDKEPPKELHDSQTSTPKRILNVSYKQTTKLTMPTGRVE